MLRKGAVAPFDAADVARLRELVPHLARAVLIQSRLIDGENTADGFRQSSRGARDHIVLLSKEAAILEIDPQLSDILGLKFGDSIGRSLFGKAALEAIAMGEPVLAELAGRDGAITRLMCEAQASR